jgi:putative transposon-encoded protein
MASVEVFTERQSDATVTLVGKDAKADVPKIGSRVVVTGMVRRTSQSKGELVLTLDVESVEPKNSLSALIEQRQTVKR